MNRTLAIFVLAAALSGPFALAEETVTAKKIKGGVVDCHADQMLEDDPTDLTAADFGGPRTAAAVHGRALKFTIGSRTCWVDRSDIEIDGLPPPMECVSGGKALANRGVGTSPQCEQQR